MRQMVGSRDLAVYMDRFAYFFRVEFLAKRMFEVLNSESKPEHAGFRKSCDTLYEYYKVEVGAVEDTLVEHLYDEYFIELDVDACAAFFRWFGVIKPAERTVAVAGAAAGDEAPSAVNVPLDAVVGQDEWQCGVCTFVNSDLLPYCEMCDSKKEQ